MPNMEVIACFNPDARQYLTESGRINEAFHNFRVKRALKKATKEQNRAAKHAANYTAHAAKKLNAADFHHYSEGNHHLISKKGQNALAKKRHVLEAYNKHNEQAKQHIDHASDMHSLKEGHGMKQAALHKDAQQGLHAANTNAKVANRLANKDNSGAHKTAKNNFHKAISNLNTDAENQRYHNSERLRKGGLQPHDLHMIYHEGRNARNHEGIKDQHPEDYRRGENRINHEISRPPHEEHDHEQHFEDDIHHRLPHEQHDNQLHTREHHEDHHDYDEDHHEHEED